MINGKNELKINLITYVYFNHGAYIDYLCLRY